MWNFTGKQSIVLNSKVVVTGGMGYIGSHTVVDLIQNRYDVIIIDDLSRSSIQTLDGIERVTGIRPRFYPVNLCNRSELIQIFEKEQDVNGCIHFAAYKYVDESVQDPILYFRNNLNGQLNLLECIRTFGVSHFVYSSSCSVYGNIESLPVSESTLLNPPMSPYASTKVMGEQILNDVKAIIQAGFISLRYFNPVGAHSSGEIGESPSVTPTNLVPRITGTAIGKFPVLKVFGNDLPTRDGTCIRDYIHVMDIAEAHTAALCYLEKNDLTHRHEIINLGSGAGVSVLELIRAFEEVTGQKLNYEFDAPRSGDVIAVYSDITKAKSLLNWSPKRSIQEMMMSAWNWEKKNYQDRI